MSRGQRQSRPTRESTSVEGIRVAGRYRLAEHLGTGAMGTVFTGFDETLEREVAIKFVKLDNLSRPELRARFMGEARAMARTQHPNIVQIYDYGEHDGVPYIVMEYLQGTDLGTWLERRGRVLAVDEALGIADQLCRGVQAIHDAGVVHRDLKPANALIGPAFRVALTDFGLVRASGGDWSDEHGVAGTPAYMAPEVATNTFDPAKASLADVYSLAVMIYELLTGSLPFAGSTAAEVMSRHVYDRPPLPSDVRPELHSGFDRVLLEALSKDPGSRTRDAESLRRELARVRALVQSPGHGIRILFADDDVACRAATVAYLHEAMPGVTVEAVADGRAALAAAKRAPPSIAVVDLSMPGMNGVELTAALRSDPHTSRVPIVVVTGIGSASDWQLLRHLGADGFLVKPVDPEGLVSTIRRLAGT